MKVKIIKDCPPEDVASICSPISQYIGQVFDAYYIDGCVEIYSDEISLCVFDGEYEIVEMDENEETALENAMLYFNKNNNALEENT